jgi:hypothetical protein
MAKTNNSLFFRITQNSSHKHLVILSVPLMRLVRVLLSDQVIGALRPYCDVLIISPFAENRIFQSAYGVNGTLFLEWKAPEKIRQPVRSLFTISSLLRIQGYWRRFRNQGMDYYVANSSLIFGDDGNDERITLLRRIILFIISIGGMWTGAWRLFDSLIGPSLFNFPKLREVVENYKQVTLIQSASWGIQDQMLAWMGRQGKWRKVMIPYTIDQLFCNGYLYSDFDAICVQGPFEEWAAKCLHKVSRSRIVKLGSAWFRHLDEIKQRVAERQAARSNKVHQVILYAGVSSLYFKRSSEYLCLDTILRAIDTGELVDTKVIYRPLGENAKVRAEIQNKFGKSNHLRIQFAQQSCYGLDQYQGESQREELDEYITQLLEADIVVMCHLTSLALDAAYLGIPTIANLSDPSGMLSRRHTHLIFNRKGQFYGFESIPVIKALDHVVPCIKELLNDKEKAASIARRTIAQWDFPETDFQKALLATIDGSVVQ